MRVSFCDPIRAGAARGRRSALSAEPITDGYVRLLPSHADCNPRNPRASRDGGESAATSRAETLALDGPKRYGRDVEPLSLIIGAALGSAGLSGALAGVLQFSRAERSARLVEQMKKSLEGDDQGVGEQSLRLALDRERLRLASLSIVGAPRAFSQVLILLVISALMTVLMLSTGLVPLASPLGVDRDRDGVAGEAGSSSTAAWIVALLFVIYIVFFAIMTDLVTERRRAHFMAEVGAPDADIRELARLAGSRGTRFPSPRPQTPTAEKSEEPRGRRNIAALVAVAVGIVMFSFKRLR